jgi:hypothetical protein
MRIHALFALLFFLGASVLAQEPPKQDPPKTDDPIAAQLLKDKEAHVAALDKAREGVLKAFDKHYETVKNNKSLKIEVQLAQLEKIEAEKKAFDENGVPPALPGMKVALSEFRAAQKKSEATCKLAFEKAAKAYRDKGEVKTAVAVLEEMKEFLAKTPTAAAVGAGNVVLVSTHSGKVIGLTRGNSDEGTRIVTADYVRGDHTQVWKIVPAADGYAYIENVKSGLVIACDGKNNGSPGHIEKKKDGDEGQLWKLNPVRNMKGSVVFVRKGTDRALAITQGSKNAGIGIILWDDPTDNGPERGFTPTPPK